ncbi:vWA domain-containing protein [Desertihabitans aurantiacus]|uniref:vWA domain-containing protein n=1 Tax=Desertihabitans aurantiacus TaxID=2282477 RepID=UPI0018E4E82C|nr:VWA domain-containing protein [Desertihabitans aurantiacus]
MQRLAAAALSLIVTTAVLLLPAAPAHADEPGRLLLVMDSSGSMAEPAGDGRTKIEAAKTALGEVIDTLPDDAEVGMRVYGSEVFDRSDPGACEDSRLAVEIGTDNREQLRAEVESYQPYGETPIAYALERAAEDVGDSGQRSILLVSDGEETCVPDPCPVAERIAAAGIDLRIDVVGLRVSGKAREQLTCIADRGRGTYYDAEDTDELTETLRQVQERAVNELEVNGRPVQGTVQAADAPAIGPGSWVDEAGEGEEPRHYRIERQIPGSTLWAGVFMRPETGMTQLDVDLLTTASESCGSDTAQVLTKYGGERGWLLANALASEDDEECAEGDLVLRVAHSGFGDPVSGQPYQLVVTEEPPVEQTGARADDRPAWQELGEGPRQRVQGGSSMDDAPEVGAGTVTADIVPGEIQFFRVPLDFGQRLQARAVLPEATGYAPGHRFLHVQVLSPVAGDADGGGPTDPPDGQTGALSGGGAAQASAGTPTVLWANRRSVLTENAALAGDYLVAVSYTDDASRPTTEQRALELQLGVFGEAGNGAPTYRSTEPTPTPSAPPSSPSAPAPSDPAPSSTAAAGQDQPDDPEQDGIGRGWLLGGAAAGVVLFGGLGVLAWRLLRRG